MGYPETEKLSDGSSGAINWLFLFVLDMLRLARKRLSLNVALLINYTGHSLTNVSLGRGYKWQSRTC